MIFCLHFYKWYHHKCINEPNEYIWPESEFAMSSIVVKNELQRRWGQISYLLIIVINSVESLISAGKYEFRDRVFEYMTRPASDGNS